MADDEGIKRVGPTTWKVRVKRIAKATGRVENRKATVEGTKADARRRRDELRAELESTVLTRPRTRLSEYAASWLERRAANPDVKRSVIRKYGYGIGHVLPVLGDLYLDSISPADVAAYIAGRVASAGPRAGNTVLNELRMLRTMARDSVAEGYAASYWCDRVRPPRVVGYTREWLNLLTAEQFTTLIGHIPQQWRGLVLFIASTGLRWGEASALHWEDVDLDAGEAAITRGNDRGRLITVKTRGSDRVVPVLPEVAALWGPARARGLVFPSRKGTLYKGSPLKKVLDRTCTLAGVPRVTAHGLRRTFNNLMRRKASREVLKSLTGHTTDEMVGHYSHVGTDEKEAVVRSVAETMGIVDRTDPAPPLGEDTN